MLLVLGQTFILSGEHQHSLDVEVPVALSLAETMVIIEEFPSMFTGHTLVILEGIWRDTKYSRSIEMDRTSESLCYSQLTERHG